MLLEHNYNLTPSSPTKVIKPTIGELISIKNIYLSKEKLFLVYFKSIRLLLNYLLFYPKQNFYVVLKVFFLNLYTFHMD